MKKHAKAKSPKNSSKRSPAGPVGPDLVTAMMKLVERLEVLERKTDQVLGRLSNLPSEIRDAVQHHQRPEPPRYSQPSQRPEHGTVPGNPDVRKERIMYKAVCADCYKSCEVPFRPSAERPVYCKECFAIRKAGHVPQDPDKIIAGPRPPFTPTPMDFTPQVFTPAKGGKQKSARKGSAKPKKKTKGGKK